MYFKIHLIIIVSSIYPIMTIINTKLVKISPRSINNKLIFITVAIFLLFSTLLISSCTKKENEPLARKGILDLRTWNFELNGPVELSGEWEFFWKEELKPADFLNHKAPEPSGFIRLPRIWNGYRLKGEKLGPDGYATFRLRLLTGRAGRQLAVKVNEAYSAYSIYINGSRLGSGGVFGKDPEHEEPRPLSQVIAFSADRTDLEIIINVSNFHDINGGIDSPILLGEEQAISDIREKNLFYEIFLFGSIIFMGFYHLFHYAIRRTDRSSLYFGIFCVATSPYSLTFGERYLLDLFPHVSWTLLMKIVIVLFYLGAPIFAMYWHSLYPEEFSKKILRAIQAIGAALFIVAAAAGPQVLFYSLKAYEAFILIACIYVIYVLIVSSSRKREGSIIFLTGFLVLFLAILNDSMYDNGIINTGIFIPWGIFIFLISQSVILSVRHARAFTSVERLSTELAEKSDDLQNLNIRLEQIVQKRSRKLEKSQDEMKTLLQVFGEMNDNLLQVTRELENAHKTMEQDMEMAASVQAKYFPPAPPRTKDWDIVFIMKPLSIISGDLYDFYMEGDRLTGVSLFDVSGHGAASGLITMITKSISHRNFIGSYSVGLNDIMQKINAELIQEIGKVGSFVTGVMLRFRQDSIDYVNAGHPDIIIKRKESGKSEIVGEEGKKFKGHFMGVPFVNEDDYGVDSFTINRGDSLLIYSDSLIESANNEGEQYGIKRLIQSFDGVSPDATAEEQLNSVMGDFVNYLGGSELADDLTAILLKKV